MRERRRYGGDVRVQYPYRPSNRERNFERSGRFNSSNSVRKVSDRFGSTSCREDCGTNVRSLYSLRTSGLSQKKPDRYGGRRLVEKTESKEQLQKLAEFNHLLSSRGSTSMKFEWENLLSMDTTKVDGYTSSIRHKDDNLDNGLSGLGPDWEYISLRTGRGTTPNVGDGGGVIDESFSSPLKGSNVGAGLHLDTPEPMSDSRAVVSGSETKDSELREQGLELARYRQLHWNSNADIDMLQEQRIERENKATPPIATTPQATAATGYALIRDNNVREGILLDPHSSLPEHYREASRQSSHMEQDQQYEDLDGRIYTGGHGYGDNVAYGSYEDGLMRLQGLAHREIQYKTNMDDRICIGDNGYGGGSCEEGLMRLQEPEHGEILYKNIVSPQHIIDLKPIMRRKSSPDWNVAYEISDLVDGDEHWGDGSFEQVPISNNSGVSCSHFGIEGSTHDYEMVTRGIYNSAELSLSSDLTGEMLGHWRKHIKLSKYKCKDARGASKQTCQTSSKDIKKRLGPAGITHETNPWPLQEKHKNHLGGDLKTSPIKGFNDSTKVKVKFAKTEPSEESEEFRQLVNECFLKSVKVLNQDSSQRAKFMERRGTGTLRCSICASDSKEFVDTLSLATHAFMTRKVGSRAEHLGFHKALCLLMGWKSAVVQEGPWVRQVLSDSEAILLKEDLIIWPPVVVIHNNSIANNNPDEHIILSILRGMGFGKGMTKVCRGRVANQSIMVVCFHGTFSGLREAEMVHKFFADNKRGRVEFQRGGHSCCNTSSSGQTPSLKAKKVQSVLYGYVGISTDLDKLDSETKKRCVVRSKKDIQAIVDASLKAELQYDPCSSRN
ncbi:uncharacterized protein LOC120001255 isoform X2 [Tripterygium wilfordii]|uniref:uncharacterized protein LOC120001255 isoform X2 n=1 Tax=Tripterygium wilfordii TaxID=458696 RepID=UPI0018F82137|nr:uncharacterized protein LOC120001255 isoform X2 [Tripterygium wilfordii]